MMFWSDHDMGGWGYASMAIGVALFWILLVVGTVVLVRYVIGTPQARIAPGSPRVLDDAAPEQVLAGRFARGEIDESEFRRRLDVLRSAAGN